VSVAAAPDRNLLLDFGELLDQFAQALVVAPLAIRKQADLDFAMIALFEQRFESGASQRLRSMHFGSPNNAVKNLPGTTNIKPNRKSS
jgi:hypothetical protein